MSAKPDFKPQLDVEVIAYAPTEFYHCQHCEIVWGHLDFGQKLHAEQRRAGQLPPELQAEYAAISDWILDTAATYGQRIRVKIIDAVSIEGLLKSIRHRSRRFPVIVINGSERFSGFDRELLDRALEQRLGQKEVTPA
ncbi:MAG TPA: hypothetical protein VK457_01105 [Chloroflexota bacterium]|nr:hypothetical protein [Chloroflexota bacterium]